LARRSKEEETMADALDKIFAQVDPEVILVGGLGAIAAYGGITPPLTRILMSFSDIANLNPMREALVVIEDSQKQLKGGNALIMQFADRYLDPFKVIPKNSSGLLVKVDDVKDPTTIAKYAVMASGAMEAMMVMTLLKNPATIQAIGNAVAAGISATGDAVSKVGGGAGAAVGMI